MSSRIWTSVFFQAPACSDQMLKETLFVLHGTTTPLLVSGRVALHTLASLSCSTRDFSERHVITAAAPIDADIAGRVAFLRYKLGRLDIAITGCYFPPKPTHAGSKAAYWRVCKNIIAFSDLHNSDLPGRCCKLSFGDINCHLVISMTTWVSPGSIPSTGQCLSPLQWERPELDTRKLLALTFRTCVRDRDKDCFPLFSRPVPLTSGHNHTHT